MIRVHEIIAISLGSGSISCAKDMQLSFNVLTGMGSHEAAAMTWWFCADL